MEWRRLTPEGEWRLFVEGCPDPRASTILALGSSIHVKEGLDNAVNALAATLEDGRYVGGGGAFEVEVAKRLREYARETGSKEQLAINAFAECVESVPMAIASNAGMNWLDVSARLNAEHAAGEIWYGIDAIARRVVDVKKAGLLDPLKVKMQAINSATEAALMILRIDEVIRNKKVGT